jgi:aminoglycoside phosphotransferase (APT) family kinase protein
VTGAGALLTLRTWAASLGDARLAAAIERVRPLADEAPVFVHGDPNLGNVLFDDALDVAGIIDWEDSAIADRRFDLATAYWFLLLRAPGVAGDFIAAYEAASGKPVRDLPQWLAFQTVRAWAIGGMLRAVGSDVALFSTDDEKAEAERRLHAAGF